VSTFEDAADDLVVKLKGLDSEIEESRHTLEELARNVQDVQAEVEREWTALAEAVTSFLEKARDEAERLDQQVGETLRDEDEARQGVATDTAQVQTEAAEGHAQLEALAQHATGLEQAVDSLVAQAGEAPAQGLGQRAEELEQGLGKLLDSARDFLHDEVVSGLQQLATDVHERGQRLRQALTEEHPATLQQSYDDWENHLEELEDFVSNQAFVTSRANVHAYVEWAVGECQEACEEQLDALRQVVDVVEQQLQEMATAAQTGSQELVDQSGTELVAALGGSHQEATAALAALGAVRALLASYSFMEA
jgi:DNA repair exonuclease SbcCD ATPase subunit